MKLCISAHLNFRLFQVVIFSLLCGAVIPASANAAASSTVLVAAMPENNLHARLPVPLLSVAQSSLLSVLDLPQQVALTNSRGTTCAHTPVAGLRLIVDQLGINWMGAAPLQNTTVVVAFEDSNLAAGQYICEVGGQEFDAIFGSQNSSVAAHTTAHSVTGCSLQCGAVKLVNLQTAFQVNGTVTVIGTTQIANVPNIQQQASVPITLTYTP